jgi:hypothetical protein
MKAKLSYATCSLFVVGLEMDCPLCGLLVKSGQRHTCEKPDPDKPAIRKPIEGRDPSHRVKVRRRKL